ncbi:MAG: hypothetical protein VX246_17225 [Myxococcota bacterium]|nr:hypothetical protein [Myxococcota bacterium]
MLSRFETEFERLAQSDSEVAGAWTRGYLAATVTREGKAVTNTAQLMGGILATLGREPAHLEELRRHFTSWQRRVGADGVDPITANIVRLTAYCGRVNARRAISWCDHDDPTAHQFEGGALAWPGSEFRAPTSSCCTTPRQLSDFCACN